ncbi:Vacuolar protein sorting-associated protein 8-like [Vitis vinifera]|uniref:Vacuolar protein sorting-associated protein 8-like n=1 Tax=Vitis vinifera TaxID=29760 RepID=A0A438DQN1_VITVI|nr:Vacuolar protein sorting-associated protein 8-like [Vitis vinifera]
MTKKLSAPPMELDLDSFIHLTSDDDDDDALNRVPHRTVDEILNDSDSSSSSLSPSDHSYLAKHSSLFEDANDSRDDVVSVSTPKTLSDERPKSAESLKFNEIEDRLVQFKANSLSRVRTGDLSGDSFSLGRRVSRPLPPLFGSVRSNAKPGAALAAAAAASRPVPTPHAAAIKSRRAGSGALQRVLDTEELGGSGLDKLGSSSDVLNGAGSEIASSDWKSGEEDDKFEDFQSATIEWTVKADVDDKVSVKDEIVESSHRDGEVFDLEKVPTEVVHTLEEDESRVNDSDEILLNSSAETGLAASLSIEEESFDLNEGSAISGSYDVKDQNIASDNVEETASNSTFLDAANSADKDEKVREDLTLKTQDLEPVEPPSTDGEVNIAGDDWSPKSDVTELVEERLGQLESKMGSKRTEKKPRLKPLELAEELEKSQASTGLHWEEGAAAQPMRLEGVRRGSTTLGYFEIDNNNTITRTISSPAFKRDHGSPQVLAVHLNFIAVGMSRGVVMVVPSKYSAYNADNMDAKILMLGLQGERSHAPVTSMCFNHQGDLLLAGYGDGHITVWDVQRATAAKVITGEHSAPVIHTLFLGQDSQVTRQFKAVTGDSKGLVLLHAFSVVPCLIGSPSKHRTGTVLSASPLLLDESSGSSLMSSQGNATGSTSSIGSMMGGVVGGDAGWKLFSEGSSLVEEGVVIFVTHQTALVVRLSPSLEVYAQLNKPDGVREGSMPYTAWKCMTIHSRGLSTENTPVEASERVSLLAIAWDRKVQVAKLVKSELKIYGKWTLESTAIGVAWLDDQILVVLTSTGQLCLFAKDGTVIHQTSFAVDGSGGDDPVAYHTYFTNIFGNPEKAYQNSIAVRGASIYILGPVHLVVSRLLTWKERIQVLRKAGDWMGALNMAMTLYDGNSHGVIDLPRSLEAVQEAIMPYLVELLLSYVDEVFSYISVAFCNQIGKMEQLDDPKNRGSSVHFEIKEQFTRVGGVAVEFCVHIKRTDILFDEIFSKFVGVQHRVQSVLSCYAIVYEVYTFLELLEPYILKDMLGSLPPEIMQALVEHYSSKGWLQRVEQCVLHMDISSLDFNQVVRLCREHGLYGALIYLFNRGLDDFKAPLEELLVVLLNRPRESASSLGYRMLVYLKYCFSGLAFPPGHGTLPPTRLPSLRTELVQFLLEDLNALNSQAVSSLSSTRALPNLYHLLELDTEATLDVLRYAFVEDEITKPDVSLHDSTDANMEAGKEIDLMGEIQNLLVQNTVNALIHILDISQKNRSSGSSDIGSLELWPSKKDMGHLFEFVAYYVACKRANVSKTVLSQILEYLTSENKLPQSSSKESVGTLKRREKQVLALLEVVPEKDWDASYVLHLCEKAEFYQVCGLIHSIRHQYLTALDSYMKDVDEPVHAFSFINHTLSQLSDTESAAFRSAVISRIPELVNLSREGTFFLIIDHFNKESPHILSELRSHPKSLFLYLKTVIEVHLSGTLNFSCLQNDDTMDASCGRRVKNQLYGLEAYLERILDFPKLLLNNPVHVTDEMIELYLEVIGSSLALLNHLLCPLKQSNQQSFIPMIWDLAMQLLTGSSRCLSSKYVVCLDMVVASPELTIFPNNKFCHNIGYQELLCQYEHTSVLKFLETFESYRVEHCLRLCQEYGIIDAAAFLLERVGDVGSALLLTLSGLNDKFNVLETAVGSILSEKASSVDHLNTVLKMKEVSDIYDILHTCIGLCQRNTPRLVPEESESLWFQLLDS